MKQLIVLFIFVFLSEFALADLYQKSIDENVFGKYKITALESPRGDIKTTLKIWKDDNGEVKAEFVENGEKMPADKVEITGNEIYIERYSEQGMYNEEWKLKVEEDKISGYANAQFRVFGNRIKQNLQDPF
ncbi:hypothetical protein [Maribellus sediminis]|uniref:hypothetical protein n=1 Tax=Maribellus sediminis TaxID=2696285 RepID=UPI001430650B|nr:hypothetical protein [Maribellus sediminis]